MCIQLYTCIVKFVLNKFVYSYYVTSDNFNFIPFAWAFPGNL